MPDIVFCYQEPARPAPMPTHLACKAALDARDREGLETKLPVTFDDGGCLEMNERATSH